MARGKRLAAISIEVDQDPDNISSLQGQARALLTKLTVGFDERTEGGTETPGGNPSENSVVILIAYAGAFRSNTHVPTSARISPALVITVYDSLSSYR